MFYGQRYEGNGVQEAVKGRGGKPKKVKNQKPFLLKTTYLLFSHARELCFLLNEQRNR